MGENKNTEIMLKDIGMIYRTNDNKDVTALTSVNLDIQKGEFVSLVGPSGYGAKRVHKTNEGYRRKN